LLAAFGGAVVVVVVAGLARQRCAERGVGGVEGDTSKVGPEGSRLW
jgi:hypothetical protein